MREQSANPGVGLGYPLHPDLVLYLCFHIDRLFAALRERMLWDVMRLYGEIHLLWVGQDGKQLLRTQRRDGGWGWRWGCGGTGRPALRLGTHRAGSSRLLRSPIRLTPPAMSRGLTDRSDPRWVGEDGEDGGIVVVALHRRSCGSGERWTEGLACV